MSDNIKLKLAEEIEAMLRDGYNKQQIAKKVEQFDEELLSIAKARIKNSREKKISSQYIFNEDDLRFCTNQSIAGYRAERLRCGTIVDIGCGIGIQAIEFAKKCKKVIAIEKDKRKIEFAKENAEISKIKNIEFINDDAIRALENIKSADIIFWDPERPESERERSLESLKPSFSELKEKAHKITKDIAIEIPPQIENNKIKEECELEYSSVDNKLNRLTLYLGKLKRCSISVVSLPSKEKIEYNDERIMLGEYSDEVKDFIYEIDTAVVKSELTRFLIDKIKNLSLVKLQDKIYATSEQEIKSNFLKEYQVIGILAKDELKRFLFKYKIANTIIHGSIAEREYADLRASIQSGLEGAKTAHLFLDKDKIIVALKI
jgi:16S rRNA G966 N2-methylase RsmD